VTAPRQSPAPDREDGPRTWPPESEEWFSELLDGWPPLSEQQRERLRALLDLGGDHDAA
jgi:hypothetical protein